MPVSSEDFEQYWMYELSAEHRKHACFFAMPELVQLINQTNSRLIYQQLVKNVTASKSSNANHKGARGGSATLETETHKYTDGLPNEKAG